MGSPVVNSENVWDIYCELHHRFEHLDDAVNFIEECQVYLDILDAQDNLDDAVPPVGRELYGGPENRDADGAYYMGGVNNGRGLGMGDFKCAACMNEMVLTDFFVQMLCWKIN
jgi:hypothetical protein